MIARSDISASIVAAAVALVAAVALHVAFFGAARAQPDPDVRVEEIEARAIEISRLGIWGNESGAWRTKTQLVFDRRSHQLARRTFTAWDPAPSQNLDFAWTPSGGMRSDDPIISGEGQLIWRTRDKPSYDPSSVVSVYRGSMQNGRPSGHGEHKDITGIAYEGEWVEGNPQGPGHLRFPNGDDYEGAFLAGKPNGQGRYIDATGEIYQGPFVNGRREGRATTTLPNGAVYQSEWRSGIELASSRYVRLAQVRGGTAAAAPSSDDVRLGVLVNPLDLKIFRPHEDIDEEFLRFALGYVGTSTEKGLEIRPDNNRLTGMWKGDTEIQLTPKEEIPTSQILPELSYGVFSYGKTLLPPVNISLEVQNRATVPIQITGAYLDVEKSRTDRQPAIQVSVGADDSCGGGIRSHDIYSPKLTFENFGWGHAQNAKISYDFVSPESKSIPTSYKLSRALGDIDKVRAVNFEQELNAAGVDTRFLAGQAKSGGFKCSNPGNPRACIKEIGGANVFGTLSERVAFSKTHEEDDPNDNSAYYDLDLITIVAGALEYDWTDASGSGHRRSSPFRANLWLGKLSTRLECGDGASVKRIRQNPLDLKLDQARYRIAVPFRQGLPAGRVARYALLLNAARASDHDFTVVLQLADGREIRSRPVNLLYFLPSWYPRRAGS
jgi:hypothetical protein